MNRWRLDGFTELRELGAGAQGRVVLARPDGSDARVAIKYLASHLAVDERHLAIFRREAQTLTRVANPHVARLYQYVEGPGGAAIVMEAVEGASLRRLLERNRVLDVEAALTVLKGSLLGLAAAHSAGVVHRDYKPENVVVQHDGLSKLIDFGIAVLSGEGSSSGTPAYMAPEQWRDAPASPATDVYAASCVFFECVTGTRPYRGGTIERLMAQHLSAPIPVDMAPEPVRELLARGMAKDPGQRLWNAAEFVHELEATATAAYGPDWERRGVRALAAAAAALAALFPFAILGSGGSTGADPTGPGSTGAQSSGTAAEGSRGVLRRFGSTKVAIGAACVIGAVLVGGGLFIWEQRKASPKAPTATQAPAPRTPGPQASPSGVARAVGTWKGVSPHVAFETMTINPDGKITHTTTETETGTPHCYFTRVRARSGNRLSFTHQCPPTAPWNDIATITGDRLTIRVRNHPQAAAPDADFIFQRQR
jgi:hypothetical protein